MLGHDPSPKLRNQPLLEGYLSRICERISASAAILIHNNGQIISRSGNMNEENFPIMAALISAIASAAKSMSGIDEDKIGREFPARISCESEDTSLYVVAVDEDIWLATLYRQPLNPGQIRMEVRRHATSLGQLLQSHISEPQESAFIQEEKKPSTKAGATLPPSFVDKSSLFENITDDEIDNLFNGAEV